MKAKLLTSLRVKGKRIPVSEGRLVIVDLDQAEFERLEALGSVVKPTKDELTLAGANEPAPKRAAKAAKADDAKGTETPTEGGGTADGDL